MPSDENPPSDSTGLERLILDQSVEGTAIPVVLFSDDTLAAGENPADQPATMPWTAAGLGIDPDALDLFSFDAYRLQSALGAELAP